MCADNVARNCTVRRVCYEYGSQMIFEEDGRVRLTNDELNRLRMYAAQNGYVVDRIRTTDDLLEATILGLTDDRVRHMLTFMEANSAPSDSRE